jgi:hypothetical protein
MEDSQLGSDSANGNDTRSPALLKELSLFWLSREVRVLRRVSPALRPFPLEGDRAALRSAKTCAHEYDRCR